MSAKVIQWYPGHMAKARRQATENIGKVDVVIELVDARIPESSRNPIIDEIIADKKRILVLNKSDLAIPSQTNQWLNYYESQGLPAVSIDSQHSRGINKLQNKIKNLMSSYFTSRAEKGIKERPIRLMILGIPNVGKSTLINRFVGKNQAQTGNKPGVTKAQRWLKVKRDFELLDTPGILWPKFEDPDVGKKLAITGAIKDDLLYMDDLALYLLNYLVEVNPTILTQRYRITSSELSSLSTVDLLLKITENMGLRDDYDQASHRLIVDLRQNRLGTVTLDFVPKALKKEEKNEKINNKGD